MGKQNFRHVWALYNVSVLPYYLRRLGARFMLVTKNRRGTTHVKHVTFWDGWLTRKTYLFCFGVFSWAFVLCNQLRLRNFLSFCSFSRHWRNWWILSNRLFLKCISLRFHLQWCNLHIRGGRLDVRARAYSSVPPALLPNVSSAPGKTLPLLCPVYFCRNWLADGFFFYWFLEGKENHTLKLICAVLQTQGLQKFMSCYIRKS